MPSLPAGRCAVDVLGRVGDAMIRAAGRLVQPCQACGILSAMGVHVRLLLRGLRGPVQRRGLTGGQEQTGRGIGHGRGGRRRRRTHRAPRGLVLEGGRGGV